MAGIVVLGGPEFAPDQGAPCQADPGRVLGDDLRQHLRHHVPGRGEEGMQFIE